MKRRDFLKALGIAIAAPSMVIEAAGRKTLMERTGETYSFRDMVEPLNPQGISGKDVLTGNEEALHSYQAKFTEQYFDFGHQYGMAIEYCGRRHAVKMTIGGREITEAERTKLQNMLMEAIRGH